MSKSYASTNLCASKIPSCNNPLQQWMLTPPPFAIEDLSFRSSTDNISIYERAKTQRVILKYRGVPLLRNLWLPIIEDATIHHSNERRHPIFNIDDLSFRPWTKNISIYVHAKNQRKLPTCGRVLLLENFVLPIYGDATIHHRNECRYPHFAIDNLSFWPSTDNISINVHAEYQRIIPIGRRVLLVRNFWIQIYGHSIIHHSRAMNADAPLLLATSLSGYHQEIYQSTCLQKISVNTISSSPVRTVSSFVTGAANTPYHQQPARRSM